MQLRRPYMISFVSQKGGTGKTTSTVNVGAAFLEMDLRVLVIDLDPQGGLSRHLGVKVEDPSRSVRAAMAGAVPLSDLVVQTRCGLYLVPGHGALATIGTEIVNYAEQRLAQALEPLEGLPETEAFHFVLIDCPPSLDLLTINGMHAADAVVITISPQVLPAWTLPAVVRTIQEVRNFGHRPNLRILGVLPCMAVSRTRLTRSIQALLPKLASGVPVLPEIRQSVKVAEAPGQYLPILQYERQHPASEDYRKAARRILAGVNGRARW
jgi:chromosome partitioning protein